MQVLYITVRQTLAVSAKLFEAVAIGRRLPGGQSWLLDDLSLGIDAGNRLAVVGASGSGKTLLLRALALLDPLDAGEIRWRGRPIADDHVPAYRREVMYLHQRPVVFPGSVEANLRAPFELRGQRAARFDRPWIVEQLRSLGREAGFLDKSALELSGGEAQLVALLRAVQLRPVALLLDEPTASLDPDAAQAVERFVARWWEESPTERAIVWVTHDERQSGRVADVARRLHGGRWQD